MWDMVRALPGDTYWGRIGAQRRGCSDRRPCAENCSGLCPAWLTHERAPLSTFERAPTGSQMDTVNARDIRISRVAIRSFRGIPNHLSLDLRATPNAKAASLILIGDNGSGKSSIIDAMEFALQGRYAGTRRPVGRHVPSPISLATGDQSSVSVELSDGTVVTRGFKVSDAGSVEPTDRTPDRSFSISPMVLRRADLLRFVETSEVDGQTVFFEYLRAPDSPAWEPTLGDMEAHYHLEMVEARRQMRLLKSSLADELEIPRQAIPEGQPNLRKLLRVT